jgi:hypothetical protein
MQADTVEAPVEDAPASDDAPAESSEASTDSGDASAE